MTQHAIIGSGSSASFSTASTTVFSLFGAQGAITAADTTESDAQTAFRCGTCTIANLRATFQTNARTTVSTVTIDVNAVASSLVATTTASTPGTYSDLTHTVSVADTDKITYAIATGTGTGGLIMNGMTCDLQSAGQSSAPIAGFGAQAGSTSRFYYFAAALAQNIESASQVGAMESATTSNMQCVIPSNSSTGFSCTFRKSGANGNQVCVVGSAATGLFEDATNTDSLSVGNLYDFNKPSASASATLATISCKYLGGTASTVSTNNAGNATLASGTTRFSPLYGQQMGATEAQQQTPAPFTATLSLLATNIGSNASIAGTTLVSRVAGGTGNQTISIGTSTGFLQDITNTDSVTAGQLLGTQASGSSGNVVFVAIGMIVTGPNTGGISPQAGLTTLGVGN